MSGKSAKPLAPIFLVRKKDDAPSDKKGAKKGKTPTPPAVPSLKDEQREAARIAREIIGEKASSTTRTIAQVLGAAKSSGDGTSASAEALIYTEAVRPEDLRPAPLPTVSHVTQYDAAQDVSKFAPSSRFASAWESRAMGAKLARAGSLRDLVSGKGDDGVLPVAQSRPVVVHVQDGAVCAPPMSELAWLPGAVLQRCQGLSTLGPGSTWGDRYRPRTGAEVLGNEEGVRCLSLFLDAWKARITRADDSAAEPPKATAKRKGPGRPKRSKRRRVTSDSDANSSDDFVSSGSDFESAQSVAKSDDPPPGIALFGPPGVGKTAAVYACAAELGFAVFELNSSMRRTGKCILDLLGEATQSHQVAPRSAKNFFGAASVASASPLSAGGTPKEEASRGAMSLIVIDEIDAVFEDDRGFWSAVSTLLQQSKRPVVLIGSNASDALSLPTSVQRVHFSPPPTPALAAYAGAVCAAEGAVLHRADALDIAAMTRGDVRRLLQTLQFWVGGDIVLAKSQVPAGGSGQVPFPSVASRMDGGMSRAVHLSLCASAPLRVQHGLSSTPSMADLESALDLSLRTGTDPCALVHGAAMSLLSSLVPPFELPPSSAPTAVAPAVSSQPHVDDIIGEDGPDASPDADSATAQTVQTTAMVAADVDMAGDATRDEGVVLSPSECVAPATPSVAEQTSQHYDAPVPSLVRNADSGVGDLALAAAADIGHVGESGAVVDDAQPMEVDTGDSPHQETDTSLCREFVTPSQAAQAQLALECPDAFVYSLVASSSPAPAGVQQSEEGGDVELPPLEMAQDSLDSGLCDAEAENGSPPVADTSGADVLMTGDPHGLSVQPAEGGESCDVLPPVAVPPPSIIAEELERARKDALLCRARAYVRGRPLEEGRACAVGVDALSAFAECESFADACVCPPHALVAHDDKNDGEEGASMLMDALAARAACESGALFGIGRASAAVAACLPAISTDMPAPELPPSNGTLHATLMPTLARIVAISRLLDRRALFVDYAPALRTICEAEAVRQVVKSATMRSSRRFRHYILNFAAGPADIQALSRTTLKLSGHKG